MRKAITLFLLLTIAGLSFVSCQFDDTTYCPYCGSSLIKEDGKGVLKDGTEFQMYKCQSCGKRFGVEMLKQNKPWPL
ncbi:hypothetical protein R84B8_00637 [Treponema sp. R8-4-B8]